MVSCIKILLLQLYSCGVSIEMQAQKGTYEKEAYETLISMHIMYSLPLKIEN